MDRATFEKAAADLKAAWDVLHKDKLVYGLVSQWEPGDHSLSLQIHGDDMERLFPEAEEASKDHWLDAVRSIIIGGCDVFTLSPMPKGKEA